jgi:DNA primase
MRTQEAKKLSMPQLLARLGHQPVNTSGQKFWYRSPLRSEITPSFCVEPGRQVAWIFSDHGLNVKGNILDFVMHYQHCSLQQALAWLEQIFCREDSLVDQGSRYLVEPVVPRQICRITTIRHPALLSYLKERAIETVLARRYLREVHYQHASQHRFALGWKTDAGGWCLRTHNFKAFLAPAGITTIGSNNRSLAVFEGIFDFLSSLSHYRVMAAHGQVVILNSVNHAHIVANKLQQGSYQSVKLYLDNDAAGRRATQYLLTLPNTVDCSDLFSPAKDFAQWYENVVKENDIFLSPVKNLSF